MIRCWAGFPQPHAVRLLGRGWLPTAPCCARVQRGCRHFLYAPAAHSLQGGLHSLHRALLPAVLWCRVARPAAGRGSQRLGHFPGGCAGLGRREGGRSALLTELSSLHLNGTTARTPTQQWPAAAAACMRLVGAAGGNIGTPSRCSSAPPVACRPANAPEPSGAGLWPGCLRIQAPSPKLGHTAGRLWVYGLTLRRVL